MQSNNLLFFDILINFNNAVSINIQRNRDDDNTSWLNIVTANDSVRLALPVGFDKALDDWRTLLHQPPAHTHTHSENGRVVEHAH